MHLTTRGFQSAAAGADWKHAPGFYEILTDEPGKDSWPITGATFISDAQGPGEARQRQGSAQVLRLGLSKDGDKLATELKLRPNADAVVALIHAEWKDKVKDVNGKPIW